MPFRPPSRKERRDAIGLHAATAELRRWLDPDPFSPIAIPGEDDWLAEIPGAKRSHDNASKAPSKKKSKSKKKHKKKSKR